MKRISLFLSGLLFFVFLVSPVTVHAARTVSVGVYAFQPLIFLDEKKDPAGLFIDVLKHVARKEGWQVHYGGLEAFLRDSSLLNLQSAALPDLEIRPVEGPGTEILMRFPDA